jgi:hypothetical protein
VRDRREQDADAVPIVIVEQRSDGVLTPAAIHVEYNERQTRQHARSVGRFGRADEGGGARKNVEQPGIRTMVGTYRLPLGAP